MNKWIAAITLSLAVGSLSGCIISVKPDQYHQADWEKRESQNRQEIARLSPGLSLEEITHRLGVPDFSEYHDQNGEQVQVLFYRTHRNHGDGVTSKDECTPLVFKDNHLSGWGDGAYRTY